MKSASFLPFLISAVSVASVTAAIAVIDEFVLIANISMLYLVAVIGLAVVFGKAPAVFASVLGFLAYDLFFVEPLYTFTVADASEWLSLFLFLISAIITGQLAAGQRVRAIEAEQRERETALLYDLARLMGNVDRQAGIAAVAARLRSELRLDGVSIHIDAPGATAAVESGEGATLQALRAASHAPARLLVEGTPPTADARGGPGRWVRSVPSRGIGSAIRRPEVVPVKAAGKRVGSLVVVRGNTAAERPLNEERLLTAVAAQVGAAAELDMLRGEALEAEALRREDELKTALLNAVSHDLKSPLASIIASSGSLQQTDVAWTEQERLDFAAAIEHEAQRLDRLVSNLLDLSRLESGSLNPDKDWYDLAELIDEVLARLKPALADRPVAIDVPRDLPPVELDYIQIDEVLSNLIENAAKYSPEGSPIEVRVEESEGRVVVSVADQGPGVLDPTARRRIFEPFYRVPGTGKRGTGLGLAVARGLVEAHGGSIWLGDNPGGGARFSFSLPAPAAKARHQQEAGVR